MAKGFLVATVAAGVAALIAWALLSRERPPPSPVSFTFANGLEARVLPADCGPRAAFVVLFAVGTDHAPANRSGMVQVLVRLLAAQRPGLRVEASPDHTRFVVEAPHDKILDELESFARRLVDPEWSEAALMAAKTQVLDEIERRSGADPELAASTYAAEAVLPSPGRGRRGGIAQEVEAIELSAVRAFWQAHFTAANARLVVAGQVETGSARARIEQAFGKLPSGTSPTPRAPGDLKVTGTLVMGDAPTAVAIAVPAPVVTDRAFPAFLVHASRLGELAPDAQDWVARYDPIDDPGLLLVTGPVRADEQPEAAAARIRLELTTILARPVTAGDVDAARKRFAALLVQDGASAECKQGPQALALAIARRPQLGLDRSSLSGALDDVTPAQFEDAAVYFSPERTAAVIAGGEVR